PPSPHLLATLAPHPHRSLRTTCTSASSSLQLPPLCVALACRTLRPCLSLPSFARPLIYSPAFFLHARLLACCSLSHVEALLPSIRIIICLQIDHLRVSVTVHPQTVHHRRPCVPSPNLNSQGVQKIKSKFSWGRYSETPPKTLTRAAGRGACAG